MKTLSTALACGLAGLVVMSLSVPRPASAQPGTAAAPGQEVPPSPPEPNPPNPPPAPPPLPVVVAPAAPVATPYPQPAQDELADDTGFHIGLGLGPSGDGDAGFSTQVKIGGRVTSRMRVYYHALNHWAARPEPGTAAGIFTTEWRVKSINGLGLDYFVLPKLGLRISGGLGANTRRDPASGPKALGYSYTVGVTVPLNEGRGTLSVDPYIHMIHYNSKSLATNVPVNAIVRDNWVSSTIVGVTLNWCYR